MKAYSFLLLFIPFIASCTPQRGLNEEIVRIGNHELRVEIADSDESRQQGLMNRDSLDEDRGMLFIFQSEQMVAFWMKNTSIPLSVAYIAKSGEIKEIHDLEPHNLQSVPSRRSVLYALEVNQGYFEERGIKVGDYIERISLDN